MPMDRHPRTTFPPVPNEVLFQQHNFPVISGSGTGHHRNWAPTGTAQAHMPSKMTALCLSACFRNNETLKVLLAAKAEVNGRDARGDGALHWACVSDNGEGVRRGCPGGSLGALQTWMKNR